MTRRLARRARPSTLRERRLAVHADAYPDWCSGDPVCATCHRIDCPRYWRIQGRLDRERTARRTALLTDSYGEEPW